MRAVSSSSISPSARWNSLPFAGRNWPLPSLPAAIACPIILTASDRHKLKKTADGHRPSTRPGCVRTSCCTRPGGCSNARIAADTRLLADTVRTWRGRFAQSVWCRTGCVSCSSGWFRLLRYAPRAGSTPVWGPAGAVGHRVRGHDRLPVAPTAAGLRPVRADRAPAVHRVEQGPGLGQAPPPGAGRARCPRRADWSRCATDSVNMRAAKGGI